MLETIAMLAFAASGSVAALVAGSSLTRIAPACRRLVAERQALAADRIYLVTLIETPRPDPRPSPAPAAASASRVEVGTLAPIRRPRRAFAVPLRAAA